MAVFQPIDDQREPGRKLYRQIARFCTAQNPVHIGGSAANQIKHIGPIGHQQAFCDDLPGTLPAGVANGIASLACRIALTLASVFAPVSRSAPFGSAAKVSIARSISSGLRSGIRIKSIAS